MSQCSTMMSPLVSPLISTATSCIERPKKLVITLCIVCIHHIYYCCFTYEKNTFQVSQQVGNILNIMFNERPNKKGETLTQLHCYILLGLFVNLARWRSPTVILACFKLVEFGDKEWRFVGKSDQFDVD